jgi:hypothetical protein
VVRVLKHLERSWKEAQMLGQPAAALIPQDWPAKKQQQHANARTCQGSRSRSSGVGNGDAREPHPCPPDQSTGGAWPHPREVDRRRRSKVGAIRKNAKDEQERSAEMLLGRFTALEPLAKGACFNCGDAIAHLMEFAARKNPSRTSKDWRLEQ